MDEVSNTKNVEWHPEYEKLHFYSFVTIMILYERAMRRLVLDSQQVDGHGKQGG